jgi:iron(III) transport system ATP-binding protein
MEYTVAAPVGQLFVVDRNVSQPIAAGAEVSITLSGHGIALVPG